jgi:hypothetical protein
MLENELAAIRHRADSATPGPWHVEFVGDTHAMNLVAVTTGEIHENWPQDSAQVVAATLVQGPERYASIADGRWDDNAAFIAHARDDVPRLLAEIARLHAEMGGASSGGTTSEVTR